MGERAKEARNCVSQRCYIPLRYSLLMFIAMASFETFDALAPVHYHGRGVLSQPLSLRRACLPALRAQADTPQNANTVSIPVSTPLPPKILLPTPLPSSKGDYVDIFCRGTNALMKKMVLESFREKVDMKPAGTAGPEILDKLLAAPEFPGMSRPLWLVITGSLPTLLGWYGYYKFSVEEELFQDELASDGRVTGCGGYGTLFPFVFLGLIGALLKFVLDVEEGAYVMEAGGLWIVLGQINLYRRINHLFEKQVRH